MNTNFTSIQIKPLVISYTHIRKNVLPVFLSMTEWDLSQHFESGFGSNLNRERYWLSTLQRNFGLLN